MISVEEARARIRDAIAARGVAGVEEVALAEAMGRTLARDVVARRDQPPWDAAQMDGWALAAADAAAPGATLRVAGEIAAGAQALVPLSPGEAARIFTGAPLPPGADCVVAQEDCAAADGRVTLGVAMAPGRFVRRRGLDFAAGQDRIAAPRRLTARDVGLAAAMGHVWLPVRRRPRVAILATGDEIARPGDPVGPAQIISSNALALAGLVLQAGGEPVQLGVAADRADDLARLAAEARGCDLLVTSGGASAGDHDLVRSALLGAEGALGFWRIAMRPGKPLMFGQAPGAPPLLGLPGNPVSTLVCGVLFLRLAVRTLLDLADDLAPMPARLTTPLAANDGRADHLRARLGRDPDGGLTVTPFAAQDSSLSRLLAEADALALRPPHAPAAPAGAAIPVVPLAGVI